MDGREGPLTASLRFRLSLWISTAILLGAAITGVYAYHAATEDAHRGQDTQLRQVGYLISRLDAVPTSPMARERVGDVDFDARLVVRFLDAPGAGVPVPRRPPYFSASLPDGLQTVTLGSETWRVFVRTNQRGVRVAVAQQTAVRDAAARSSALWTVMPILLLGPVLVLLVVLLVRAMFQPLQRLAAQLRERREHDLGQLERAALPSEVWPFVSEINKLIARTARALTQQRRFIADAAHELRSPMTAMSLQAERLAGSEMPDEARERLGVLSNGLARTRVLLDQLLTLARTQESRADQLTRVGLKKAIQECLEDLVPLAEAKAIDLGVVGDADPAVLGRPVEIRILVKNLIDNAIRYTPQGGRVDISVAVDGGRVILDIDDTGPGIPVAERERVFDPFYRVLGSGEIGSGLGLAITSSIADQIGARMSLLDKPDGTRGLRVRVGFPACGAAGLPRV
ncbi:sensor histidine kinase [Massilia norwichensis]|uniref:histidine kinase n=1 Tax=Massilia norwichensis TaxID=1442366 RepID=A0ABT2A089_9BURK|nr:ATP-binding protein [Massilia norwichensis]MCS0587606.1 ATP-binding protein [Massilia norwichensis]